MGFWSTIGGFFRKVLGIKPKEIKKEEKIKELPKPKDSDKYISEIKEGVKEEDEGISIPEEIKESRVIKLPTPTEIKKAEFKNKLIEKGIRFYNFTKEDKEKWEQAINKGGAVVKTPFYFSMRDLSNNRYQIYRDIILSKIREDEFVNKIYQSGILDEHIVGVVSVTLKTTRKDGLDVTREIIYQVQGLTPDKAIGLGLHNIIMSASEVSSFEIKQIIERACGLEVSQQGDTGTSSNTPLRVGISFNYA